VKISEDDEKIHVYADCSYCGIINLERKEVDKVTEETKDYVKRLFTSDYVKRLFTSDYVKRFLASDYVKIFLIIFVVVFGGASAFLYYQVGEKNLEIEAILAVAHENYSNLNESYRSLERNYLSLLNTSAALEGYYSDLQDMYSSMRSEYSILEDSYSNLTREKAVLLGDYFALVDERDGLEEELEGLLTFSEETVLDNMTVEILSGL